MPDLIGHLPYERYKSQRGPVHSCVMTDFSRYA